MVPLDSVERVKEVLERVEITVQLALVVVSKCAAMGGAYADDDALRGVRDLLSAVSQLI